MESGREITKRIRNLSPAERKRLRLLMLKSLSKEKPYLQKETGCLYIGHEPPCPHCGEQYTIKFGKKGTAQRWRCKQCGKTFSGNTKGSHKRNRLVVCLSKGMSYRVIARRCGISERTAFTWRKRIFDSLKRREFEKIAPPARKRRKIYVKTPAERITVRIMCYEVDGRLAKFRRLFRDMITAEELLRRRWKLISIRIEGEKGEILRRLLEAGYRLTRKNRNISAYNWAKFVRTRNQKLWKITKIDEG